MKLLQLLGLIFCLSLSSYAQENQYLEKIGVLDSISSQVLGETREIFVQLPDSFNPESKEKYPVVYVLDGEVFVPTVANVLRFYSGGFTPEMIVVGINNGNTRMRDLTTSRITEMNGRPFNFPNGEADKFTKFIASELIPHIEKNYPATSFRTLIGHSYGGLFTLFALVHHPDLFQNYIAIDPSLDWDNQKLIQEAKTKLIDQNYTNKSLFVSLGGQLHMQNPEITINNVMDDPSDFTLFARSNITFSQMVEENLDNGLRYKWKFYPNDLHGTISIPSILDGLVFDFEWFQMENTHLFNSPETPKEELLEVILNREQKLETYFGYSFPPLPEYLLNMSGYMNMDMQQFEKSKMFFELAIKYYPESSNVYDSMADFYERSEQYEQALNFRIKSYNLSKDENQLKRIEDLRNKTEQGK